MSHEHGVIDGDSRYIIDAVTREIKNESGKLTIVQYDHNSERLTFELPRIIDGHDMSLCNSVQVHFLNVDSATKEKAAGIYEVDDMSVCEDAALITCTWLIAGSATQHVGKLNFMLRFACICDGVVEYAWNTATYTDMVVTNGIFNSDTVAFEYADILAEWEARITALERGGGSGGTGGGYGLSDSPPAALGNTGSAGVSELASRADHVHTHPTLPGMRHIPPGGTAGQILGWADDGTAQWVVNASGSAVYCMTGSGAPPSSQMGNLGGSTQHVFAVGDRYRQIGGAMYVCVGVSSTNPQPSDGGMPTISDPPGTKYLAWEIDRQYIHPDASGNKHIPAGGMAGQILGYLADGTAQWQDPPASSGGSVSMCSLSGQIASTGSFERNTTHNVDFADIVNTNEDIFSPSTTDSSITVLEDGVYMIIADARAGGSSTNAIISVVTVYTRITHGGATTDNAIGLMYGATRYNNASGVTVMPLLAGDKLQLALNASMPSSNSTATWEIINGVGGSGKLLIVKL